MKRLNLDDNPVFDDLVALAGHTALTHLSMQSCRNLTNISALVLCGARLTHLDLSLTILQDFAPLSHCTALTWLSIEFRYDTDLTPLAACKLLQVLRIRGHKTAFDLHGVLGGQLMDLDLSRCTNFTDIEPLAQQTALTRLNISKTKVGDIGSLAACTTLTQLDLSEHP